MRITIYVLLCLAPIVSLTACAPTTVESTPTHTTGKIEADMVKIATETNIPSLDILITTPNDTLRVQYNNPQVQHQAVYGIGSTTKFLSAVFFYSLVEQQRVAIEDKLIRYLDTTTIPHIRSIESITIKQLLNHSSGLSDYTKNPQWIQLVMDNAAPTTFQEKIALISDTLTNTGTFSYSNTNYTFLEKVVEAITQQSYSEAFEHFYASVGLPTIQLGKPNQPLQSFFATTGDASSDVSQWDEHHGYAGGVYTTPHALSTLLQKLFRERSILHDTTLLAMQEWIPMQPMGIPIGEGAISDYGNGIMKLNFKGKEYIGHSGGTLQYQSFAFHNLKENISIVLVTNCSGKYYNRAFFQEMIPSLLKQL